MSSDISTLIVQVVVVVIFGGGSAYGVLRFINDRRKLRIEAEHSDADNARILNTSAVSLLAPAREQVDFLRRELGQANVEILDYRARILGAEKEIGKLTEQVKELSDHVKELVAENRQLRAMLAPVFAPADAGSTNHTSTTTTTTTTSSESADV